MAGKMDRVHWVLVLLVTLAVGVNVWQMARLKEAERRAVNYKQVGAYAFIKGRASLLKAAEEQCEHRSVMEYMTAAGAKAYEQVVGGQIKAAPEGGNQPKLPSVDAKALEEVLRLAS